MVKKNSYLSALGALYGNDSVEVKEKKATVPNLTPTEEMEQILAATWLSKSGIPFFHIPNGGYRRYAEALKLKRMGVMPGVPDLCVPLARKGHHGLYIELKRVEGGRVSDAQRYWGELLTKEGYLWRVAKGAEDVKKIVGEYLA